MTDEEYQIMRALPTLIDRFEGSSWSCYSNFSPAQVKLWIVNGLPVSTKPESSVTAVTEETYDSTEHAFQAAKFLSDELRSRFRYAGLTLTPGQAKRLAYNLRAKKRKDWEDVSIEIMRGLLKQKFTYSILRRKLLSSFSATLIEGNTWHDNFWGNCVCGERPECEAPGQNWLGKLLMEIRTSLIS
jgi:ribA/ribD-fused uncharacterized protein